MAFQFDRDEFGRWYGQAAHTLESAQRDFDEGDYAWACFKAQQAAEYGCKGLLRGYGKMALGHSVLRLLNEMRTGGIAVTEDLLRSGRLLDRHYIPPRYPDAYPAGSPFEFYDRETAREALEHARLILRWLEEKGAGL